MLYQRKTLPNTNIGNPGPFPAATISRFKDPRTVRWHPIRLL